MHRVPNSHMDGAQGVVSSSAAWLAGQGVLDKIQGCGVVPFVEFFHGFIDFFLGILIINIGQWRLRGGGWCIGFHFGG